MNKWEFEQRIRSNVTDEAYKEIEYVYTWHPAISETSGKDQIASIYKAGGILVIKGMKEMAGMMEKLEAEKREVQNQLSRIQDRINAVLVGELDYEYCLMELEKIFDASDNEKDFSKSVVALEEKYGKETVRKARNEIEI